MTKNERTYPIDCGIPKDMKVYENAIRESEGNVYAGGVFANPVEHKALFDDIIKLIDMIPDECNIVLDVGCNDGTIGKAIGIRKDIFVIGVDICYNHVLESRKRGISAMYGNIYEMNLPYVDCVFMRHTIEHMYDVPKLLKDILKTKYLVLTIPVCKDRSEITDENIKKWHEHDKTHYNIGTIQDWINIIEDCNYEIVHSEQEFVCDKNNNDGCLTARILAKNKEVQ